MAVVPCPSCNESVRIPSFASQSIALMKCPWCGYEASPDKWEQRLPPPVMLLDADGAPVSIQKSSDQDDSFDRHDSSSIGGGLVAAADESSRAREFDSEAMEASGTDHTSASSLVDLQSAWEDDSDSVARRLEREREELFEHPGELPAALDFEGELSEIPSTSLMDEEPAHEAPANVLAGSIAEPSTRPKVPLSDDQRSYYQRHPIPKRRWSAKMIFRVLGPAIVAAPIVLAIAWHAGLFNRDANNLVSGVETDGDDDVQSMRTSDSESTAAAEDASSSIDPGGKFTSMSDRDSAVDRMSTDTNRLLASSSEAEEPDLSGGEDIDAILQSIKQNVDAAPIESDSEDSDRSPTPFQLAKEYDASRRGVQRDSIETESYLMLPPKEDRNVPVDVAADEMVRDADVASVGPAGASLVDEAASQMEDSPILQTSGQTEFVPLIPNEDSAELVSPDKVSPDRVSPDREDSEQSPAIAMDRQEVEGPDLSVISEPKVVESVTVDPEVEAACEAALQTLERLQEAIGSDTSNLLQTKLAAYRDLATLGSLESGDDAIPAVLRSLDSETRSLLGPLCGPWIKWSNRQTDGLLLVGRLISEEDAVIFEVDGGERYRADVPTRLEHLVSSGSVISVGRLLETEETSDDTSSLQKIRLTAGVPVPL